MRLDMSQRLFRRRFGFARTRYPSGPRPLGRLIYNVGQVKRFFIFGAAVIFVAICAAVFISFRGKPTESDYKLARGRSQLFTENYLAALQTLREIRTDRARPEGQERAILKRDRRS